MRVLIPFGTRPEVIKLSPIVRELRSVGISTTVVATGQHYDYELAGAFHAELDLSPDESYELPKSPEERVGVMLNTAMRIVGDTNPDLVLVLGDTFTVPLFCFAARARRIPVAHVEAGLRSFNETSIEEVNRRIAAVTASVQFAPTELAARFLYEEGIAKSRVWVVGNPVLDVLRELRVVARPAEQRRGILVTAHRATNVDDPYRLEQLILLLLRLRREFGSVLFPVHPRTKARLSSCGGCDRLQGGGVELLPPLPYGDMLGRLAGTRVVVTDSGGLQEEAAWLGIPTVVLRRSTPRWESVANGSSVLVGVDVERACQATKRMAGDEIQKRVAAMPCPYGDGHAAKRIAEVLLSPAGSAALQLVEKDFVGREPPR